MSGETIKYMGFSYLIILVAISSVFTWAQADPFFSNVMSGVSVQSEFTGQSLDENVTGMQNTDVESQIETAAQDNPPSEGDAFTAFYDIIWNKLPGMAFGWMSLVDSLVRSTGLEASTKTNITYMITAPLFLLQIFFMFYLVKDIWSMFWGAG